MSKITPLLLLACLFIFAACGETESRSQETIKKDIEKREKEISDLSKKVESIEDLDAESEELIDVLLEFYRAYPKEEYAAGCLSKVHMIYARMGDIEKSVAYGDTLLNKYPNFVDRAQIIESQIQSYEMMIEPRDVEKISSYLKMWLKENKNAPKQKIEDMEYHLKFVSMSLKDRMRMNLDELN